MNQKLKPFLVVGVFWLALFLFVIAGYSGDFGSVMTGFAVSENGKASPVGLQSIAILFLFFTNLVTLFFLVREIAKH
jgi:hypothetical protein